MTIGRAAALRRTVADARGGRVLFVSHCLLNENVRYLGGAGREAAVTELVEASFRNGVGLVQMPCPEQRVWGGVLKRRMLSTFGRGPALARRQVLRRPLAAVVTSGTAAALRPLAWRVAAQVDDYQRSGMTVVGIVGVGCSPSCGVARTLDVADAIGAMAACPLAEVTPQAMNRIVATSARPGTGIFIRAVRRALRHRGVAARWFEHDLLAELAGSRELPVGLAAALTSAA